jgi:hypothetical protein
MMTGSEEFEDESPDTRKTLKNSMTHDFGQFEGRNTSIEKVTTRKSGFKQNNTILMSK